MNEVKTSEELLLLVAECTAYDYKLELEEKKPKSWLKSVSAFSNGEGGSLFFGVNNDGVVEGLESVQTTGEKISEGINDRMDPLPDVEMIPYRVDGKDVLQLKVNAGRYTPYYYVGDGQRVAFVRKGSQSVPATGEEMVRLVLKGSNQTFDSLVTADKAEENSFAMLAMTYEERTKQTWNKKYLQSFGLVTQKGGLTNAGALFADYCSLSQSRLYCTRWDGLEKTDALNDAEFKGNILLLLREAMNFVKANTRKGWEKLPDGRKNKPEYAERAVLEACVNHLIHRDYTVIGGEVHLDIYEDRIALTSPGGMYSGQMVQDIPIEDISSNRRNPILADVMAQLDYMEKRGSGLKRICKETKELETYKEGRIPVFRSSTSQFMTIIYSMEYDPVVARRSSSKAQVATKLSPSGHQVVAKLSPSIPKIKETLQKMTEPMSAKDMRFLCGQKDHSHFKRNVIDPLVTAGLIAMTHPDSPKSPKQKYFLTEYGKSLMDNENTVRQAEWVSTERVNRLIAEFAEALPQFPIGLPKMDDRYKASLPIEDVRCFYVPYLMKKEMFQDGGMWVYETPELYLHEIQGNIWQHYNVQFLLHRADASYQIRFSEIKEALKALGVDEGYAVITSFNLGTFDALYGGEVTLDETDYGYQYGNVPIYRVPFHEARMIVMRRELLPRCEEKIYEGEDNRFKLINEQHLLYSNIFNMKEEDDGVGLIVMRDLRFCYPDENNFHYVRLVVDRMERVESEFGKIRKMREL